MQRSWRLSHSACVVDSSIIESVQSTDGGKADKSFIRPASRHHLTRMSASYSPADLSDRRPS